MKMTGSAFWMISSHQLLRIWWIGWVIRFLSVLFFHLVVLVLAPRWLSGQESTCHTGDMGSLSGLGRSPGEGSGNPLQYSRLENSTDRGAWWATVQGVTKSQTRQSTQLFSLSAWKNHQESWKWQRHCLLTPSLRHLSGAFLVVLVGVACVPYLDKQCPRAPSVV